MLPNTSTETDTYNRGVEDYRKLQTEQYRKVDCFQVDSSLYPVTPEVNSPSAIMRDRSSSVSPIRSRSPRKRSRSPHRPQKTARGRRSVCDRECRVYVSNLNYDTRWMDVKDVMKKIGNVEHVEIFTDNDGRSKGCAIVEFTDRADAAQAIKELDGMELAGRKLRIREDNVENDTYREQLKTQKDKSRNYARGPGDNQQQLFPQFGGVGAGALGGLGGLGAGTLALASSIPGLGGLQALLGAQTQQLQLLTMLSAKNGEPLNSSVFVSNLDYGVTWQKLKDTFRRAGNCLRCDIAQGDDKKSKGFGTVVFETPMEALTAIALFHGMECGSVRRTMSVRLDRNASLHQVLAQLGVNSNEINQRTLQQLQQLATMSMLGGGLTGGLGGIGLSGLGNLGGGLGALGSLSSLAGNINPLASQQQGGQQANNMSNLGLSDLSGLGGNSLGGLSALLQNRGVSATAGLPSVGGTSGSGLGGSYGGLNTTPVAAAANAGYSSLGGASMIGRSYGGYSDNRRTSGGGGGAGRSGDTSASSGSRVFVRNLPFSVKWQDLKDKFRDAGKVTRADIKTDGDNRSKGYGTVTFETIADAQQAIALFNGYNMDGRDIEVKLDRY